MSKFVLVGNSTTDETAAYYGRHDVKCASLSFTIDGRTIKEDFGQTLSFEDFYGLLRAGKTSTTSQAQMEDYLRIFREACEAGLDVLYVGFSSGLSGSYNAGCMAAAEMIREYPRRIIRCVDTLSAAGGELILLDLARRMRDDGKEVEETARALEALRPRVVHLVTVDDLGHLWRGGRVSKSTAVLGSLIGIKPLVYVDNDGKLQVCGKVRGRKKALLHLGDTVLAQITDKTVPVRISHGDCVQDAQFLSDYLLEKGRIQSEIRMLDTVLGSHTGPGVMTAFFIGSSRAPF